MYNNKQRGVKLRRVYLHTTAGEYMEDSEAPMIACFEPTYTQREMEQWSAT
jgi:hypothetical protein